jgi:hypothetical protein
VVGNGTVKNAVISAPAVNGSSHRKRTSTARAHRSSKSNSKKDDWELDCEICHRKGINLVCLAIFIVICQR